MLPLSGAASQHSGRPSTHDRPGGRHASAAPSHELKLALLLRALRARSKIRRFCAPEGCLECNDSCRCLAVLSTARDCVSWVAVTLCSSAVADGGVARASGRGGRCPAPVMNSGDASEGNPPRWVRGLWSEIAEHSQALFTGRIFRLALGFDLWANVGSPPGLALRGLCALGASAVHTCRFENAGPALPASLWSKDLSAGGVRWGPVLEQHQLPQEIPCIFRTFSVELQRALRKLRRNTA